VKRQLLLGAANFAGGTLLFISLALFLPGCEPLNWGCVQPVPGPGMYQVDYEDRDGNPLQTTVSSDGSDIFINDCQQSTVT
jgi:hypothetical protein